MLGYLWNYDSANPLLGPCTQTVIYYVDFGDFLVIFTTL